MTMLPEVAGVPVPGGLLVSRQGQRPARRTWHNGIDLSASIGTPVFSVAPGVVEDVCATGMRRCSGYGNAVLIRHDDDLFSWYAHLDTTLVTIGQAVTSTTQIGTVGVTFGTPEDPLRTLAVPHLHLEILHAGFPFLANDFAARYDVLSVLAASGVVLDGPSLVATGEPVEYVEPALADVKSAFTAEIADPSLQHSQWPMYLLVGLLGVGSLWALLKG